MENEEAVLKKQLDEAKDFETRREIRQKLRELRKKRINALESDIGNNERRSRRQQTKTEEETPVNSTEEKSEEALKKVENGEIEEEKGSEEHVERNSNEEKSEEVKSEPVTEVTNGDTGQEQDEEEKEKKEEKTEEQADDVEARPPSKPPRPADGKITEEYIEQLQDVDDLEELLKEVPLSEFSIRKKIRNVIRERKKQKELAKFGMGKKLEGMKGERGTYNGRQQNRKNEMDLRETHQKNVMSNDDGFAKDTVLNKLDSQAASDYPSEESGKLFDDLKMSASKTSTDDNTDTASTLSTQSAASEPETLKSGQYQGPGHDSLNVDTSKQQQRRFDHKKNEASSTPSSKPTDFRGQLKKTGVNLRNLEKKGKTEKFDFRTQLKTTGLSTSGGSARRKKDTSQVDFRSVLQSTTGQRSGSDIPEVKVTSNTSASSERRQYLEEIKKSVPSKPKSLLSPDQEDLDDEGKSEDGEEKKERKRRVSSADLLGLVNQPRDVKPDLAQRGGRKNDIPKSSTPQPFGIQKQLVTKERDEDFEAQMARRKKQVNTWHLKPSEMTEKKSRGGKAETSDFRKVLRKASTSSYTSGVFKKQDKPDGSADAPMVVPALSVRKTSSSEQPSMQLDTVDAGKTQPEKSAVDSKDHSDDSDVDGKEKENDGGQYTRSVKETMKTRDIAGGKGETTTRTEKQRTFGKSNIDDVFEKKRRERMMAKRKEAAEKKQGRAAFKAKLEAQNPKPANGGGRHFQTGTKITRAMIEWCRRKTYGYEGVDIQNFSSSWTNGLAICALLHRFVPDKIDYESLDPRDRRANWKMAFDVAGECGVEPLLELEDIMACSVPEPKSLMTYVHFIYQTFCEAPKEKPPPPSWDEDEDD